MNLHDQIEQLRNERAPEGAKQALIHKLSERNNKKPMKLITKLGVPAFVAIAAVGGALYMVKSAEASTESVARVLSAAQDYKISSYAVNGSERRLMSETIVRAGKKTTVHFDRNGKPTTREVPEVKIVEGQPLKTGTQLMIDPNSTRKEGQQEVRVIAEAGPDGQTKTKYFVNGKEVDELPEGLKTKVMGTTGDGKSIELSVGGNGKGVEIDSQSRVAVMRNGKGGTVQSFISGQTSAESLVAMLKDTKLWTITRGVDLNGDRFDKFTYKGSPSPIELYVEPKSSRPRVLRFSGPGQAGTIEDVYDYSIKA